MSLFNKDFQNRSGLKCNIVYTDYINDIPIGNYLNTISDLITSSIINNSNTINTNKMIFNTISGIFLNCYTARVDYFYINNLFDAPLLQTSYLNCLGPASVLQQLQITDNTTQDFVTLKSNGLKFFKYMGGGFLLTYSIDSFGNVTSNSLNTKNITTPAASLSLISSDTINNTGNINCSTISANILYSNNIVSNGLNIKNYANTNLLSITSDGITTIPSINSFQYFNRQMVTSQNVYNTSTKSFYSGIKCIHLSFSHMTTTAGTFTVSLALKNGSTTLQTFSSSYAINPLSEHQSNSFHYLTNNITTGNINIILTFTNGTGVFFCNAGDYITCIMYNLANTIN